MITDNLTVLLVGEAAELASQLANEDGLTVSVATDLASGLASASEADAVVVGLGQIGPLEALEALRLHAPDAAVLVFTPPGREGEGTVALHAGAEDHLAADDLPGGLLPRAIRYAVSNRRLRREFSTKDEETGLLNLRGFAPIAEHHLRMAKRTATPVVFVFLRLEHVDRPEAGDRTRVSEAAGVVLEAIREADVPARIGAETFCVLLTGDARGAENLVLSRLVEAIAVHDARSETPGGLSVSVGTALYDPEQGGTLGSILEAAGRGLDSRHAAGAPAD